ncbi:peptidoglycan-associated lipoprotein Pal [Brevundimonas sp.]|uniref:peptidoglycan-associated lipoprotein Pal n=2 Tax=Pseudomonadota TaxID=1224 RepID=UPI0028A72C0C|nr:peptidoglycan-associated lipoprotein Pal [Brevundimonas sp.]
MTLKNAPTIAEAFRGTGCILMTGLILATATACARRPVTSAVPDGREAAASATGLAGNTIVASGTALPGTAQDFIVNVGDRVYFDLDSYRISPEAFSRLDAQALWLQQYPQVLVRIEGNADERGTREYNLALGARRAESIRSYLVNRGVPAARIDTISFGKERPIAFGATEDSFAQNRNGHTANVAGAR